MSDVSGEARFTVGDACVGCGACTRVCPGQVLEMGPDGRPHMAAYEGFGWNGCWKCQHCLSACPVGAISIFGLRPEDSLAPCGPEEAAPVLDSLIANRHTCRRFLDKNVDRAVIDDMISRLGNAPNGGNKQQVEFALIDDGDQMRAFRTAVRAEMEHLCEKGVYPEGFDRASVDDMRRWEERVRPDMLFCGAPHLLVPHAPLGVGEPVADVNIACAYFELLCASRGLGCAMMTFPLGWLDLMPELKAWLHIPEGHYVAMSLGFGYPEIRYRRGSQRAIDPSRVTRLTFDAA